MAPVLDRHRKAWYVDLGIDPENLRGGLRRNYSLFQAPSTWNTASASGQRVGRLEGIANRLRLSVHSEASGAPKLDYFDPNTKERWATSSRTLRGLLTRSLMAFLIEAYHEDEGPNAKGELSTSVVSSWTAPGPPRQGRPAYPEAG